MNDGYVGSSSCRACHQKFYELWSTSHHGLAMQLYSPEFVRAAELTDSLPIRIGDVTYKAEITEKGGWIVEQSNGSDEHRYPIEQALGGKNVYYFLTPLERGHLQVLPLAFDTRTKTWMDATLSMTMHENVSHEQPVTWRDRTLTFNTSCYGCHVSQIETNYDPANDSYHTTWREPGINCETCHGPAGRARSAVSGSGEKRANTRRTRTDQLQEPQARTAQRCLCIVPCQNFPDHFRLSRGRQIFRQFQPGDLRKSGLLSGRPRPRRELHLYVVVDEPLHEVRQAQLRQLPYVQRTISFRQGRPQQGVPALP